MSYIVPFGKFKGKTLSEIDPKDLQGYVDWCVKTGGDKASPAMIQFVTKAKEHLGQAIEVTDAMPF